MIEKKIRTKSLEELINQPRLVKYDSYVFDELSYTCLLVDIRMLIFENKKYKEVINKLRKVVDKIIDIYPANNREYDYYVSKLDDLLEKVEDK